MSISNETFLSPKNIKEISFNKLKTISKSIDINNINKKKISPNSKIKEINSILIIIKTIKI